VLKVGEMVEGVSSRVLLMNEVLETTIRAVWNVKRVGGRV